MNLRTTAIAAGLVAALGTGAAIAQSYGNAPAPQQAPYAHRHGHHGIRALIREEVQAGRISHEEGMLLEQKIRELKAERRAQKQGNYPPPAQQQPR